MGIVGTNYQKQCKQAISCAIMNMDGDYNLQNGNLLKVLLPHTNKDCRKVWIQQCVGYLAEYRKGKSTVPFNKYENMTRDSYICISMYIHLYS